MATISNIDKCLLERIMALDNHDARARRIRQVVDAIMKSAIRVIVGKSPALAELKSDKSGPFLIGFLDFDIYAFFDPGQYVAFSREIATMGAALNLRISQIVLADCRRKMVFWAPNELHKASLVHYAEMFFGTNVTVSANIARSGIQFIVNLRVDTGRDMDYSCAQFCNRVATFNTSVSIIRAEPIIEGDIAYQEYTFGLVYDPRMLNIVSGCIFEPAPPRKSLYFITSGSTISQTNVAFGLSDNVQRDLEELSSALGGDAYLQAEICRDDVAEIDSILRAKYKDNRMRGNWYSMTPANLINAIMFAREKRASM